MDGKFYGEEEEIRCGQLKFIPCCKCSFKPLECPSIECIAIGKNDESVLSVDNEFQ